MKRLDVTNLMVGDIILSTSNALISKAIRWKTKSDISHAMIYVEGNSIIDAMDEGVFARNTQRLFFEDDCSLHVLRLKKTATASQIKTITDFARSKVGTRYSVKEAMQASVKTKRQGTKQQFCSRLAAQAYQAAGISLTDNTDYCTPEDLKRSTHLEKVDFSTEAITIEEYEAWQEHQDLTEIMRNASNSVLSCARKLSSSIESFQDLDQYLINNPQCDEHFLDCFLNSGYLDVWKINLEQNPWQFDLKVLEQSEIPKTQIENYCVSTLNDSAPGLDRFAANCSIYENYFSETKLKTFEALAALYRKLDELNVLRMKVATKWVEKHTNLDFSNASNALKPNSQKWLDELQLINPLHARMTETAIKLSETVECCSICGDDAAGMYVLFDEGAVKASRYSLSLCEDCLKIRKSMFGEDYRPFGE